YIAAKLPSLVKGTLHTMTIRAHDTDAVAPHGCGVQVWPFCAGQTTCPLPGQPNCNEDSFLGTLFPAPGQTVLPGGEIGAIYKDESPLNNDPVNAATWIPHLEIDGVDRSPELHYQDISVNGRDPATGQPAIDPSTEIGRASCRERV